MKISFFGHYDYLHFRDYVSRLNDEKNLLNFLNENVGDKDCEFYFCGENSFDSFAFEMCKNYQTLHKNIKLILVLPYARKNININKYDTVLMPKFSTNKKRALLNNAL